ncbi:MAG: hypothetical protein Q4F34_05340 [Prevotellaceae bacterium]|nr:hypothetical protein [Prevotellaceae bacterium]
METNTELEKMRMQIALLNEKLNKEEIVTERMLRNTTKDKISSLRIYQWAEYLAALFVITFGSLVFKDLGCSDLFIIVTVIFMIVCAVATFMMHRKLNNADTANGDLYTVAQLARKLKKDYHDWLYFGIPMLILWLAYFSWELYKANSDQDYVIGICTGAIIGAIIGGIIGLLMQRRAKSTLTDIINQIEE